MSFAENEIQENKKIGVFSSLIPVICLVIMLMFNVLVAFKDDDATAGSNQFILLVGALIAGIVGLYHKISYKSMLAEIGENLKSVTTAIIILLLVGSLSGAWLVSGIIPTMVFYGLKILNPSIFLPAAVIICSIVSLATGSSWTTTATVGIAFIAIGNAMGIPSPIIAGAVISGAYFGDKISPLSDTTNLAAAIAGTDLIKHIKYMAQTTLPSFVITLIVFVIINFNLKHGSRIDATNMLKTIQENFHISSALFIVPVIVILLIVKRVNPLIALFIGTVGAGIFALIYQPHIIQKIAGVDKLNAIAAYKGAMIAITQNVSIETGDIQLNKLFTSKGMGGMLNTIWLIICAMIFGGVMDAIGALKAISKALLNMAKTIFGLFSSTVASCIILNLTASDQYLAIVVPGKMFQKAYKDKNLAPENLSRTLEDSGTVTSALVPWNTCGAYQSGVLGVAVGDYFIYAVFNYISPLMTLIFSFFKIKIKQLSVSK